MRFREPINIFRNENVAEEIRILVKNNDNVSQDLKLKYERGQLEVSINDNIIPWDLKSFPTTHIVNALRSSVRSLIETRLYSYDRFGLTATECLRDTLCGFSYKAKGYMEKPYPINILSEFAWNFIYMPLGNKRMIVNRINEELLENLEERVELKVGRKGDVAIYDYDLEPELSAISDSIYRTLYYLMALETAITYAKIHGLEKRLIVEFEEPEAHVFPFLLKPLVDWVKRAKDIVYIVLSTHNPLFISLIWDRLEDAKTYYVYRDKKSGRTNVVELDIEKFAKDLRTTDDLVELKPSEIIKNYGTVEKEP